MEDTYNNRTSLVKGAKDMAKEAKRHARKKVSKVVDRASDEYSSHRNYSRFQDEEDEDEDFYQNPPRQDGEAYQDNEEGSSDATEGHDDEDEIYEGEYQGIPSAQDRSHKEGRVALGQPMSDAVRDRKVLEEERQADEEELAQQYELIMQECGHGKFQWQLFFVLGLALMSDGVEVFVVGFVLPSAETDMCVPNSSSGWLGKTWFACCEFCQVSLVGFLRQVSFLILAVLHTNDVSACWSLRRDREGRIPLVLCVLSRRPSSPSGCRCVIHHHVEWADAVCQCKRK